MRRWLTGLTVLLVGACNIPERSGAGAARYATNEIAAAAAESREAGCPHAECVAHATVKGALAELDSPESQARLEAIIHRSIDEAITAASSPEQLAHVQRIAETAARSAVEAALRQLPSSGSIVEATTGALRRSLGDDGEGPLAKSLAGTVRGLRGELALFPECVGPERARCIDVRLTELSRAASAGVREGLRGVVALPLLALAFMSGLIVALLIALLVAHHRPASEPTRTTRRHRHATAH